MAVKDKPLKSIDHIMYDVSSPTSLITVMGMMVFDKKVKKEILIKVISDRLLRHHRFHKKVIIKKGKPHWHLDESFDLRSHIHHIALPAPGDYNALQDLISDLISQPLDSSKPLWQVHLIDNYKGGSVVLWRLHHAIADGIALVNVVYSLTGLTKAASLEADRNIVSNKPRHKWKLDIKALFQSGKDWLVNARYLLMHPERIKKPISDAVKLAGELGRLFFGKSVEHTLYKGNLSCSKKVAWSGALPLVEVKQMAKIHGVTINDILLVLIAGAIRHHLLKHKQKLSNCMRIVVPVNLRKKEEDIKVHNKIGMLSIELPVHIKDLKHRIDYVHSKTEFLKNSIEPVLVYNLMNVLADIIPAKLEARFAEFIGSRIAGVVTNLPGPKSPVYFAGQQIKDMLFWVPQTSPLGIGVSMMSYGGRVYLGVVTDTHLVNDPDQIIKGYYKEFELMKKIAKPKTN